VSFQDESRRGCLYLLRLRERGKVGRNRDEWDFDGDGRKGQWLTRSPDRKAIVAHTAGVDHIDLEACKKRGIKVYNSPGCAAQTVAEHAIALVSCRTPICVPDRRYFMNLIWTTVLFAQKMSVPTSHGYVGLWQGSAQYVEGQGNYGTRHVEWGGRLAEDMQPGGSWNNWIREYRYRSSLFSNLGDLTLLMLT